MLRSHWQGTELELKRKLQYYYLSCCRAIWKLLPQEESRKGVEVAEKYLEGKVSQAQLYSENYHTEGAAFNIDYNCAPEAIAKWINEIEAIPLVEREAMLHPSEALNEISTRDLLKLAAYFVDFAMIYQNITPEFIIPEDFIIFLSEPLLYDVFGNPLRFN